MSKTSSSPRSFVQSGSARCFLVAALGVVLVFTWQWLTVRHNFEGNWTGLFYTGEKWPPPPGLQAEQIKVFSGSTGYDGQFYHYAAHDPLLHRGFDAQVDNPRLRWRRILIPGLAHVLALGQRERIDALYFVVELAFLAAGIYWLGLFFEQRGMTTAWGLAFPLVPAAMISMERMTVDVALAALAVGFVLYAEAGRSKELYAVLTLAVLARETGLLLIAGCVLSLLLERAWKRALLFSTAALPWLAWAAYVHLHTAEQPTAWLSAVPFMGLWAGTQAAVAVRAHSGGQTFALAVHGMAAAGVWLAVGATGYLVWERRRSLGPVECVIALFAVLAIFLANPEVWGDSYAYARVLSPWLVCLAMAGLASRQIWMAVPLAMVIPRVAAQFATHWPGIWYGLG